MTRTTPAKRIKAVAKESSRKFGFRGHGAIHRTTSRCHQPPVFAWADGTGILSIQAAIHQFESVLPPPGHQVLMRLHRAGAAAKAAAPALGCGGTALTAVRVLLSLARGR
mmetsp:Transcript_23134/g.36191  ORF Transcript_23134/g.36191 Transcript_23134/m.36191 type:complete len:110 (-) Transcript_23134:268-597(-)